MGTNWELKKRCTSEEKGRIHAISGFNGIFVTVVGQQSVELRNFLSGELLHAIEHHSINIVSGGYLSNN